MRTRLAVLLSLFVSVGLLGACGSAASGPTNPSQSDRSDRSDNAPVDQGKLALQTDIQGDTDIAGIAFDIAPVACSPGEEPADIGDMQTRRVQDLGDIQLPSAIPEFEQNFYDPGSEHLFADQFYFLPAGCYDVETTPLDVEGDRADKCRRARKEQVEVEDGQTTEIQLINQCQNEPRGGLDAVSSVNHAPQLDDLEFAPSKFTQSCFANQVCATASDPDNDPLEFVWRKTEGGDLLSPPEAASTTMNEDGSVTQCVDIQTGNIDDYRFEVEIYDLAFNSAQEMVRIEELLAQQENPDTEDPQSRDDQLFPIYAGKSCPAQGRTVTMMLTFNNQPGLGESRGRTLAENAVEWVNPSIDPDEPILIVRDDNTQGEAEDDPEWIQDRLQEAGFTNVDLIDEPSGGLSMSDLRPYQIVWFSNPSHPVDDMSSFNAMLQYRDQIGGGLILQGDDISQGTTFSMRPLTFAEFANNGTSTCGVTTDNNAGGNYTVQFRNTGNPVLDGLAGVSFEYGNDIDHLLRQNGGDAVDEGASVQADATFSTEGCSFPNAERAAHPVITVDPADLAP